MKKNIKKDNTLIKRVNLINQIKKIGIKRVNAKSIKLLENYLEENVEKISLMLKEEMIINGRNTLLEQDVKKVFDKLKKEERGWEV